MPSHNTSVARNNIHSPDIARTNVKMATEARGITRKREKEQVIPAQATFRFAAVAGRFDQPAT
jgi:hypothetical protein